MTRLPIVNKPCQHFWPFNSASIHPVIVPFSAKSTDESNNGEDNHLPFIIIVDILRYLQLILMRFPTG